MLLLPHSTGDSVPMCCGVGSSTGAAARGQLAKGEGVRAIPILQLTGCPTASVTWAQPVLRISTCKRGHTNGASEAGWQNSLDMCSDKCRENANLLRTDLQLYM